VEVKEEEEKLFKQKCQFSVPFSMGLLFYKKRQDINWYLYTTVTLYIDLLYWQSVHLLGVTS